MVVPKSTRKFSIALRLVSFIISVIYSFGLVAGESVDEKILVTATGIPLVVNQFDGLVSVITAAEIARYQYQTIAEVLQNVPGLYVSATGGSGAQTSLFMQGTGSNHVLVLIDGIEVTNPASGGTFGFENLSLHNVERIEVLRGAYGSHHGSEAIGGVINIITQKPSGQNRLSMHLQTGSMDTQSVAFVAQTQYQALDFSISGSHFETDGETHTVRRLQHSDADNDGYQYQDIRLNAVYDVNQEFKLNIHYAYIDTGNEYDQFADEGDCKRDTAEETLGLKLSMQQRIWNASWQLAHYQKEDNNRCDFDFSTRGERDKFEWRNNFHFSDRFNLSLSVETEVEKTNAAQARVRNNAAYAQLRYAFISDWMMSLSWRADDPDDFDSEHSSRISMAYGGIDGLWLHTAYATAFKAPALSDRFGPYGNTDIKPEKSRSWEAGGRYAFGNISIGTNYFRNRIRDLIDYDPLTYISINQGKAKIEGLELFSDFLFSDTTQLHVNYTAMRAYDDEGERLLRRPVNQGTIHYTWQPHTKVDMTLRANYVGKRADIVRGSFPVMRIENDSYTLFHFTGSYQFHPQVSLLFKANNLTDRDYEPVNGYRGEGASFHVGLRINSDSD